MVRAEIVLFNNIADESNDCWPLSPLLLLQIWARIQNLGLQNSWTSHHCTLNCGFTI